MQETDTYTSVGPKLFLVIDANKQAYHKSNQLEELVLLNNKLKLFYNQIFTVGYRSST